MLMLWMEESVTWVTPQDGNTLFIRWTSSKWIHWADKGILCYLNGEILWLDVHRRRNCEAKIPECAYMWKILWIVNRKISVTMNLLETISASFHFRVATSWNFTDLPVELSWDVKHPCRDQEAIHTSSVNWEGNPLEHECVSSSAVF